MKKELKKELIKKIIFVIKVPGSRLRYPAKKNIIGAVSQEITKNDKTIIFKTNYGTLDLVTPISKPNENHDELKICYVASTGSPKEVAQKTLGHMQERVTSENTVIIFADDMKFIQEFIYLMFNKELKYCFKAMHPEGVKVFDCAIFKLR